MVNCSNAKYCTKCMKLNIFFSKKLLNIEGNLSLLVVYFLPQFVTLYHAPILLCFISPTLTNLISCLAVPSIFSSLLHTGNDCGHFCRFCEHITSWRPNRKFPHIKQCQVKYNDIFLSLNYAICILTNIRSNSQPYTSSHPLIFLKIYFPSIMFLHSHVHLWVTHLYRYQYRLSILFFPNPVVHNSCSQWSGGRCCVCVFYVNMVKWLMSSVLCMSTRKCYHVNNCLIDVREVILEQS